MTPSLESCREGIEHSLADGAPTLARVAALMGTSPRTLPRRLQEFGARFAKLRDDVRR